MSTSGSSSNSPQTEHRQKRRKSKSHSSRKSRSRSRSRSRDIDPLKFHETDLDLEHRFKPDEREYKKNPYQNTNHNGQHYTFKKIPRHYQTTKHTAEMKMYYKRSKSITQNGPNYFEDSKDIPIHNFVFRFRLFPHGNLKKNDPTAVNLPFEVGLIWVNKSCLYGSIYGMMHKQIKFVIQMGSLKTTINVKLSDLLTMYIWALPSGASRKFKDGSKMTITMALDTNIDNVMKTVINREIRSFNNAIQYGGIHLYSSTNTATFDFRCELDITAKPNHKDSDSNTNTKQAKEDDKQHSKEATSLDEDEEDEDTSKRYVAIDRSVFGSWNVFQNMICGPFINTNTISMNIPLREIYHFVWYAYTSCLHHDADPVVFLALAKYLNDKEMETAALNALFTNINTSNVVRICGVVTQYSVIFQDGLGYLISWIKENKAMLTRKGNDGSSIYNEIQQYAYVDNHCGGQ